MKKVLMFYLPTCPFCQEAFAMVEQLKQNNTAYATIEIETIDEKANAELADQYDYYYVPTYYVDGEKLHEGIPSEEAIEAVLKAALIPKA